MKYSKTTIQGAYVLYLEKKGDERGFLARTYSDRELKPAGIEKTIREGYTAVSNFTGTIRGLHYQIAPSQTTQITRCIRGSVFEVVVDMRTESPTFKKWISFTIHDSDYISLIIPPRCAHGYLTLTDNTEFINYYDMYYASDTERGIRYDDPSLAIPWPIPIAHISEKDLAWPLIT